MRIRTVKPEFWVGVNECWPHGDCCLYIAQEQNGPIKIGVAAHPVRRVSTLQCGNPRKLILRAIFSGDRNTCLSIEKSTLAAFSTRKILNEWIDAPLSQVIDFVGAA